MSYEECFETGQLKARHISKEEIQNQVRIAENYIRKAEIILDKETYDISFLTAYISIFHSARALLYKKGYKERSHFCLFEFVKHEFKDNPDVVRLAEIGQNYRETRRMVQYEGSLCSEAGAKEAINDAKNFLAAIKKLM
jgi:uncharacterized protein (UPF0332 family)